MKEERGIHWKGKKYALRKNGAGKVDLRKDENNERNLGGRGRPSGR